ncbi:MAG: hypothetical protein M1839_001684 [Geoglossum umbratile]|nr:MAG: hypothetical protein M1839_001684 [Geoglossum umbratile]
MFTHSIPIDPAEVRKTGSFTTLPVRIHRQNDLADAANHKLLKDWDRYIGDGQEKKTFGSLCELGNLCALVCPEVEPERLRVLAYGVELGFIHDDASEAMGIDEAMAEHDDFGASLDIHNKQKPRGSRSTKLKRLAAQLLLDCISIDRELGIYMLEKYQKDWVAVMEKPDMGDFKSLEEYYEFRRVNIGMLAFWPMVEFGMGFKLSGHDRELVKDVFRPAEEALMLTNDYWSWDREYDATKTKGDRLVNAIDVISKTRNITIEKSRAWVKGQIIALEKEYVQRKTEFFQKHPDISFGLKQWVELCGYTVAGNHYWCSRCPRHHNWRQNSADSQERALKIADATSSCTGTDDRSAEGSTPTTPASLLAPPFYKVDNPKPSNRITNDHASTKKENGVKRPNDSPNTSRKEKRQTTETHWYKPDPTAISSPCHYINSLPSKGIRTTLIECLNIFIQVPPKAVGIIENTIQLLHNASLILDDIEDDSPLRRGNAATHTIFGQAQAINSANFMYVQALQTVSRLKDLEIIDLLLEELECLYLGQSWDLYWKYNLICPSEEEYLNMVDNKTGGMFRLLVKLMQASSPLSTTADFFHLTFLFGRFFQIRDDYMNLQSGSYTSQKGFCEDLDEGKFSYPIVYCMAHRPEFRDQIIGVFRQNAGGRRATTVGLLKETKMHILRCLRKSGSFEATMNLLEGLEGEIEKEIGRLEETMGETNPMLRLLIKRLSIKGIVGAVNDAEAG